MNYQSIADIYAENDRLHNRFKEVLADLTDDKATTYHDGEKWTIAQIVEHIAMVENGMARICAKLLTKAKTDDTKAAGKINLSQNFLDKSLEIGQIKLEAPEIVHPAGDKTIAESLAIMEESRRLLDDIRPLFEAYNGDMHKFPHPFFGDVSAVEWLVLIGGHKARHSRQIKRIFDAADK